MSTFSGDIGPEEEDGGGWGGLVASKAELRADAAQSALERDAARYRFLRDAPATWVPNPFREWLWRRPFGSGELLDTTLDAAMQQAAEARKEGGAT